MPPTRTTPPPSPPLQVAVAACRNQHDTGTLEAACLQLLLEDTQPSSPPADRQQTLADIWSAATNTELPDGHHEAAAALARHDVKPVTTWDVAAAFSALLGDTSSQDDGAVYTPPPIAKFLARRTLPTSPTGDRPARVCDPAVGSGMLLLAAFHRQTQLHPNCRPAEVLNSLYGIDTSTSAVRRTRLLLSATATLDGGQPDDISHLHLHTADALLDDWPDGWPDTFDAVVVNPPYIRMQRLADDTRRRLAERYESASHGNFDLYYPFLERSVQLTEPAGRTAAITPNSYFTTRAGRPLRALLADSPCVEIVDFEHRQVFPDAQTYTAVVTFDHTDTTADMRYRTCQNTNQLTALDAADSGTPISRSRLQDPDSWQLTSPANLRVLDKLQQQPLQLSDLAHFRAGVATLRDRLYLLHDTDDGPLSAEHAGRTWPIERQATRPAVKVGSLKTQQDLADNQLRIIYPYTTDGGQLRPLTEPEMQQQYPQTLQYLQAVRTELAKRDRGKRTYPQWFAYGRTSGLNCEGPKLLMAWYTRQPRVFECPDPKLLHLGGSAVLPKHSLHRWNLQALLRLLRSAVLHFWVTTTASAIDGGYYRYLKSNIDQLPVPQLDANQQQQLAALPQPKADRWLLDRYNIQLPNQWTQQHRT